MQHNEQLTDKEMVESEMEATAPEQEPSAQNTDNELLVALQAQLEEARSKYLYLLSDFENYKRNTGKERIELIQTAGREVLTALIPVLDDFDRAAKNGGLSDGMALIHHKLVGIVRQKGLTMLETNPGDAFNADEHEALAELPAQSEELKGKIIDVPESGYRLGDRIVRFAKVVVGR
jgi:molecular chaperone GrpE